MSEHVADPVTVGVLGARSPVGDAVLDELAGSGRVLRFSREQREPDSRGEWRVLGDPGAGPIGTVISLMPIWALVDQLGWLAESGCRHLVALSSTSRFTKQESARSADRDLAERLRLGEDATVEWGRRAGVEVTLLRPTMIYGHERDGNVSTMRNVLRRFRVFPVVGAAAGRRQPVHVADVAWAAARLATAPAGTLGSAYTISGAEVLTYREMVDRVRATVPGPTLVLRVPAALFRGAERVAPSSRTAHTAAGMADRMASDMTFEHREAHDDFGYSPRRFDPSGP
ncbi:NAD-dependent epimerase/dehydratase family protein [Nocardioides endophyticus]|uniref:NAD-dependent epimerase/dehydratase family protein n=1 Tax=Nocardioides endophyticus TaxID=1353775 RepID=A0ABP8Z851_9ACTN